MIEIYRNRDSATVGHFQSLLESEGIRTYFRNEFVSATVLAIPEVIPALCIIDEADLERAVELIRTYLEGRPEKPVPDLACPKCGEKSPGTFAVCWKCGAPMDDGAPPTTRTDGDMPSN